MDPREHPPYRQRVAVQRSVVAAPPLSPDPATASQDSPARVGSFATSFYASTGTSFATLPPAAPRQEGPLQLRHNSSLLPIWVAQQPPRALHRITLLHADSRAETEMLSRGSCVRNDEELRVQELLDDAGSAPVANPGNRAASLAPLSVTSPPAQQPAACEDQPGHDCTLTAVGPLGTTAAAGHRGLLTEASVAEQTPPSASTVATVEEGSHRASRPRLTSPITPASSLRTAPLSAAMERSATMSGSHEVEALASTETHLPLVLMRTIPSAFSLPQLQCTSSATSHPSTGGTVSVASPPPPRPPPSAPLQHAAGTVSLNWDPEVVSPQPTLVTVDSAERPPPLTAFPNFGVHPGGAPQALHRESTSATASSPRTVHPDDRPRRELSLSTSGPKGTASTAGTTSQAQSPLLSTRPGPSATALPALVSCSASVPLLSAHEEVLPCLFSTPAPPPGPLSRRHESCSPPRTTAVARASSATVAASAPAYHPLPLTPLQLPALTPATQTLSGGAVSALARRGGQRGVRSPLEAIWLRSGGASGLSAFTLVDERSNVVESPVAHNIGSPTAAVRAPAVFLGPVTPRRSQVNTSDLSAVAPSQLAPAVSGVDASLQSSATSQVGSLQAVERDRRSVMQRIFKEPKKSKQRIWLSTSVQESYSPSGSASENA
ncbi:hypothetical protein NESM_000438000 [Novymonas esmeraldas]|uniref:Uncharacterized protein n=1 Tax=Novymonas esmeraldas TaxID=1808958 RepID=A0AAW0EQ78_9TRYP